MGTEPRASGTDQPSLPRPSIPAMLCLAPSAAAPCPVAGTVGSRGVLCLYLVTLGGLWLIHRHLASGMENFTCGVAMETSRAGKEVYGARLQQLRGCSQSVCVCVPASRPALRAPRRTSPPALLGGWPVHPQPCLSGDVRSDVQGHHFAGDQLKSPCSLPRGVLRRWRWDLLSSPLLTSWGGLIIKLGLPPKSPGNKKLPRWAAF